MRTRLFADQLRRVIAVSYPPQRIVSLVPSQSELLFELGLDKKVVGITKFCIHPAEKFKSTPKVGGTKKLNMQKIRELNPDLIIGNKEENEQNQIEELMKEFPVWMSDINVLDDAVEMIKQIGSLTGTNKKAHALARKITIGFESLRALSQKQSTAYFIWKDPYMIAGRNTFINDILNRGGFENFSGLSRYPEMTAEQIAELNPDLILLSSEPYPFKDVHIAEMKRICANARVRIVDGEMFSWYGSRLLDTPSYLRTLIKEAN